MKVMKNKEIQQKIPLFSLVSTMEVVNKAITMKTFLHDPKLDDRFIHAEDGEEFGPPSQDNIGRGRKLNDPSVVSYFATKNNFGNNDFTVGSLSEFAGGRVSPSGLKNIGGRNSGLSQRSGRSKTSRVSAQQSTVDEKSRANRSDKGGVSSKQTAKPKSKRRDSAKRLAMEKKLLAYYQSLVQPVPSWDPVYGVQQMLDGTDVDAQINKKRAHKNIMAEAFSPTNKGNRFKFAKKATSTRKKQTSQENNETGMGKGADSGTLSPPDSGYEYLKCYDNDLNGYILEDGNIIAID